VLKCSNAADGRFLSSLYPTHQGQDHPACHHAGNLAGALAPMACIRRKFSKSSSCPIRWTTRAAIGKALIPAAPISGLSPPG